MTRRKRIGLRPGESISETRVSRVYYFAQLHAPRSGPSNEQTNQRTNESTKEPTNQPTNHQQPIERVVAAALARHYLPRDARSFDVAPYPANCASHSPVQQENRDGSAGQSRSSLGLSHRLPPPPPIYALAFLRIFSSLFKHGRIIKRPLIYSLDSLILRTLRLCPRNLVPFNRGSFSTFSFAMHSTLNARRRSNEENI